MPAKPRDIRLRTSSAVPLSMTGAPGMAISTIAMSGCPGGDTASQRKFPISGTVTSDVTSIPTLRVQKSSASS